MSRVVHFEIRSDNPDKIIAFYEKAFGWKFNTYGGPVKYWLINTGDPATPGIDGGLGELTPDFPATVNTLDVANIDEALAKVKQNGGKVVWEKDVVPGVGFLAYCADPDGTIFGMMQADPKAGM